MKAIIGLGAALIAAGCSTVGVRSGTEEPAYENIARVGEVDIRRYGERIAAQTVVTGDDDDARNQGFRRLAGYIFGGNATRSSIAMTSPVSQAGAEGSQTIAMTAPVSQARSGTNRWTVQFFMPSEYAMADLPVPNDPTVVLVTVPAQTYAVLRFSGVGSVRAVESRKALLLTGLKGSGWQARGEPLTWFYDPPWTLPPLRRNEVAVLVEGS